MFLSKLFKRSKNKSYSTGNKCNIMKIQADKKPSEEEHRRRVLRKGELGEYKIDLQLDHLPKNFRYLSDVLLPNQKAASGYSQIDHLVISPYGIFVIETKNYAGEISGSRNDKYWLQNGKFKVLNPLRQNFGHLMTLKELLGDYENAEYFSLISFTRRCIFKVDMELRKITSPEIVLYDTELSDFIRRKLAIQSRLQSKPALDDNEIISIYELLNNENITDQNIRLNRRLISGKKKNFDISEKCALCQKPVSQKVIDYCLANKNRFGGKIYCFDHQSRY